MNFMMRLFKSWKNFTGQLFCSSFHTNETAVLPARVLHHWDFTHYHVSQLAKSYLDSIHEHHMICVTSVNLFLLSKVPALLRVMNDSFALRDLIDFSKRVFVVLPVMVNEANEAAIKFSRKCQKHTCTEGKAPATEFIAFSNCFHERTMGVVALTSKVQYKTPFIGLIKPRRFEQRHLMQTRTYYRYLKQKQKKR